MVTCQELQRCHFPRCQREQRAIQVIDFQTCLGVLRGLAPRFSV